MSVKGLDTASCIDSSCARIIKNNGYNFVGRYYGNYKLTAKEARIIAKSGLSIVALWENGSPTHSSYFSYSAGYNAGKSAVNYAKNYIAQPSGTAIYFAVDYDATSQDVDGVVLQYFNGIKAAFSDSNNYYKIGVYGSGAVCKYIYNNVSAVHYTMLAKSSGWRGYNSYTSWNIKQGSYVTIYGITFDSDIAVNSGGFLLTNSDTVVQIDTTMDVSKSKGESYTFKTTSQQTPSVTVGTSGVVSLSHVSRSGYNDFWKITFVGKSGQSTGIYTAGPYEQPLKRFIACVI